MNQPHIDRHTLFFGFPSHLSLTNFLNQLVFLWLLLNYKIRVTTNEGLYYEYNQEIWNWQTLGKVLFAQKNLSRSYKNILKIAPLHAKNLEGTWWLILFISLKQAINMNILLHRKVFPSSLPFLKQKQNLWLDAVFSCQKHETFLPEM